MSVSQTSHVVNAEHPWLGLSPFTEATKGFFFGRDQEIRDIFLRVREQPLTILFGKSGLGKTSLLGAGLIPKLRVEGFRPLVVRLGYEAFDAPLIQQVFQALQGATADSKPNSPDSTNILPHATLWELFHHIPSRSAQLLEQPFVLIFDQLEEIFTLTQTREREREAEELFCQLADLVENRPPANVQDRLLADRRLGREYDLTPCTSRIVITLREDYLSQLEKWKKLMPSLMRNRMALQLLNGVQALDAVVRPGRLAGREMVSEAVGARIICFVARRPAGTPLAEIGTVPPLLSLLCDELNTTRIETGESIITEQQVENQSADILQEFYNRSFGNLHPAVRRMVEDRMVTVGGHRNPMAREDAIADLRAAGVADPASAIDQLVQGRLLSTEDRGGLQRLEITHDVLAPLAVRSRDERKVREAKELADLEASENRRRLRRARFAAIIYGVLAVILVIACSFAWHLRGVAEKGAIAARVAEQEARNAERLAIEAKQQLTQQVYDNSIAIAERELTQNHDIQKASMLLESETCPPELRGWEWHYLMRLRDGGRDPLIGHGDGLYGIEYSPDGRSIATSSIDGNVKIWNATSGELIRTIDADNISLVSLALKYYGVENLPIMCLTFSPDGKQIATGSFYPQVKFDLKPDRDSPGLVRIWDVESGELVKSFQDQKGVVLAITYSLDGKQIASSSINADNSFVVWDIKTSKIIKKFLGHTGQIHQLRYSPDNMLLASADTDGVVKFWDAQTFSEIRSISAHPGPIIGLDFSPDNGSQFATAGQDGMVRVWKTSNGAKILELEGHAGAALDVDYSPDGKRIASCGADKTVRLWDAINGEPKITLRGHKELVWSIAFSPDGLQLASASFDSTARIWDATPCEKAFRSGEFAVGGETKRVNSVVMSHDGQRLITGGWDNTVRTWDAQRGTLISSFEDHKGVLWGVAISSDGKRIASASWDHTVNIWDTESGKVLLTFTNHTAPVHTVAFSPDGTRVASGGFDGQVKIWDSNDGKLIASCDGFVFPVFSVAFSPDGKSVASGGADRIVKIWDAATGQLTLKLEKLHEASIHSIAFSPDGTRIASASWDHTARIWDLKPKAKGSSASNVIVLKGHDDRVNGLAFSPDGMYIATASEDKTVRLWDANTGKETQRPRRLRAFAWSVAFTPDGKRLIAGTWERPNSIHAWNLD